MHEGRFFKMGSIRKKQTDAQVDSIGKRLQSLEGKNKSRVSEEKTAEIAMLREELRTIYLEMAKFTLLKCKRHVYEYNNQCSKMLTTALRKQRENSYIPYIISP